MKLISWNVNGIRAVMPKGLQGFLKEQDVDVYCIQETKAQDHQVGLSVDGYHQYWNSATKKGYSGTLVLSKKEVPVTFGIGIPEHDDEGRVITADYGSFFLVNVYVPNSGRELLRLSYRDTWDRDFLQYCKKLEKTKPVVVTGDLNVAHQPIDLKNPKSNYNKTAGYTQQEIDGFQRFLDAGFTDTFRRFTKEGGHYTFWTYLFNARARNAGWRIDYFLVSKKLLPKVKKSYILKDVMGSDHCPIGLEITA